MLPQSKTTLVLLGAGALLLFVLPQLVSDTRKILADAWPSD